MKLWLLLSLFLFSIVLYAQSEAPKASKNISLQLDQEPIPKEGYKKYYRNYLGYPKRKAKSKIIRIYVKFVVEKDGKITQAQILRGHNLKYNSKALRLLENSPKWKPGRKDGKPIAVGMTMPIFFAL